MITEAKDFDTVVASAMVDVAAILGVEEDGTPQKWGGVLPAAVAEKYCKTRRNAVYIPLRILLPEVSVWASAHRLALEASGSIVEVSRPFGVIDEKGQSLKPDPFESVSPASGCVLLAPIDY